MCEVLCLVLALQRSKVISGSAIHLTEGERWSWLLGFSCVITVMWLLAFSVFSSRYSCADPESFVRGGPEPLTPLDPRWYMSNFAILLNASDIGLSLNFI